MRHIRGGPHATDASEHVPDSDEDAMNDDVGSYDSSKQIDRIISEAVLADTTQAASAGAALPPAPGDPAASAAQGDTG